MSNTHHHRYFRLALVIIALSLAAISACRKASDSVVTDQAASSTPSTKTTPAPTATPAAATESPAASPTASAQTRSTPPARQNPFDLSTPGSAAPAHAGRGGNMTNMTGVTTSVYKPTPTPGDPFPPRPTPTLVVKDGKIIQEWQAPPEALELSNPVKTRPDAVRIGEALYSQRCLDCHGRKGYGNGGMSRGLKKSPTNLASKMVQANTDGELFWKITNGRSPMPANRIRFTDEQRWYIVTFLRTLK